MVSGWDTPQTLAAQGFPVTALCTRLGVGHFGAVIGLKCLALNAPGVGHPGAVVVAGERKPNFKLASDNGARSEELPAISGGRDAVLARALACPESQAQLATFEEMASARCCCQLSGGNHLPDRLAVMSRPSSQFAGAQSLAARLPDPLAFWAPPIASLWRPDSPGGGEFSSVISGILNRCLRGFSPRRQQHQVGLEHAGQPFDAGQSRTGTLHESAQVPQPCPD